MPGIKKILQNNEAHIWYAWVDRWCMPPLMDIYHSLLDREERNRLKNLEFEYLRREYLVTRALCRLALSHYVNVDPKKWVFRKNRYGRPAVDASKSGGKLKFNLSNTRSLVACVITKHAAVGVDVEELERPGEIESVAARYFTASEIASLRALPEHRQRLRFFELWTLKEAYIKARGLGLTISLNDFAFNFDKNDKISISFSPKLSDKNSKWQFVLTMPSPSHVMAIGIRKGCAPIFSVVIREAHVNAFFETLPFCLK